MSSTGQATSSTSNFQLIINALADYTKVTGIELEISTSSFPAVFEQSNSPEDILRLLQGRAKAFQEYRNGNRKLISCLKPTVGIIQAFSGIIQEAVGLVSCTSHLVYLIVISSAPLFTSEGIVYWDRHSPCCTPLDYPLRPVPL
jgi:hypothetical protein